MPIGADRCIQQQTKLKWTTGLCGAAFAETEAIGFRTSASSLYAPVRVSLGGSVRAKMDVFLAERVFGPEAKGRIHEEAVNAFRTHYDDVRTQLHIAEWHCGPTTWTTSTPQALAEFRKSLVDSYSVAYLAGVLSAAQDVPVDRLYFYSAFLRNWGIYIDGERRPAWYAFRAFADFVRAGTRMDR